MTIAIHITGEKKEGQLFHLKKRLFKLLAEEHQEDHFIFIMDDPETASFPLPQNCTPVTLGPRIRNKLMRRYWYDFKLPLIIRRFNADVFIAAGIYLSTRVKCNQILIVDELIVQKTPVLGETKSAISKASRIICTSLETENMLLKKFPISIDHTSLINPGPEESYIIRTHEENEKTREEITSGNHYFLALITHENEECFLPLMKAFSIFKKFQKSGLVMVLFSEGGVSEKISQLLLNYKYRNDVIQTSEYGLLPEVTSAAYAVFNMGNSNRSRGLNAIASGVPVVTGLESENHFGKAAMYSECHETGLAEKMMTLYKDEHQYFELIKNGQKLLESYNWENALRDTWKSISI